MSSSTTLAFLTGAVIMSLGLTRVYMNMHVIMVLQVVFGNVWPALFSYANLSYLLNITYWTIASQPIWYLLNPTTSSTT